MNFIVSLNIGGNKRERDCDCDNGNASDTGNTNNTGDVAAMVTAMAVPVIRIVEVL